MKVFGLFLVYIVLIYQSHAFWSTGHMIISRIAFDELKSKNSTLLSVIEREIDILKKFSNENNHSFVEAAIWADDNKEIQFNQFTQWHYSNNPVVDPDFSGDIPIENMNVTWAINEMTKTLSNSNLPSMDSGLAISFSWRYLLHLVGDLHQPLHASTLFSNQFPDGDEGGNSFEIRFDPLFPDITNLHSLWDACVGQYGSIYAPLSEQEWATIGDIALNITSTYPRERVQERLAITDVNVWADESYRLARDIVYDSIQPGDTVSQEYIQRGQAAVNEQLAVAGYRLADKMQKLVGHPHRQSVVESLLA